MQRRGLGLLLAAAAAYGYYRYRKMTPDQKQNLQRRGREFVDTNFGQVKNLFRKKQANTSVVNSADY